MKPKTVLVAPLNWGLGHSTRCIPIINYLLELGHKVVLASDGVAKDLLLREFPALDCIELPSYKIKYHTNLIWLRWFFHAPKMYWTVRKEHQETKKILADNGIDIIISDNRYGVYSKTCRSILITHQLYIPVPKYFQWFTDMMLRIYLRYYNEVWVPDYEKEPSLSGPLSHPPFRKHIHYIGPLSRFVKRQNSSQTIDILCIFSGPEPLRTHFEQWAVPILSDLQLRTVVVRGTPGEIPKELREIKNVTFHDLLPSEKLNALINQSRLLLSRSGYTSIMDYVKLGARAVLVPTPGQPEQEILADHLQALSQFKMLDQGDIKLKAYVLEMLSKASTMESLPMNKWKKSVEALLSN